MRIIRVDYKTYSIKSSLPLSLLVSQTDPNPPSLTTPIISTIKTPTNIIISCTVSVHNTAFNPP